MANGLDRVGMVGLTGKARVEREEPETLRPLGP